jgi:hypothetical protein
MYSGGLLDLVQPHRHSTRRIDHRATGRHFAGHPSDATRPPVGTVLICRA